MADRIRMKTDIGVVDIDLEREWFSDGRGLEVTIHGKYARVSVFKKREDWSFSCTRKTGKAALRRCINRVAPLLTKRQVKAMRGGR